MSARRATLDRRRPHRGPLSSRQATPVRSVRRHTEPLAAPTEKAENGKQNRPWFGNGRQIFLEDAVDRSATDVTSLLEDLQSGSREALDALLPLVYAEMRRIAARTLRNART